MRFQSADRPTPWLNRRDQFRLLRMVAALALVLAAVKWASGPDSWRWLAPPPAPGGSPSHTLDEFDFRVHSPPRRPVAPDTFRAVAAVTIGEESAPGEDAHREASELPGFPQELLETIEDNSFGLRRREAAAYHRMLLRIDELPDATAAAHARDDVAYTVLMLEPDVYRGRLLTVTGDLRRLGKLPAGADSGFDALYEGWLFSRDSGTNPYRIVCTRRPAGLQLSESLDPPVPVRVTGFFFKRYGYASRGGQHVAPMLIAKTLLVEPATPAGPADGPQLRNAMLAIVGVVVAGVVILGVGFFVSDRRFRNSRLKQLAAARLDASGEDLAALERVVTHDPHSVFASRDAESVESRAHTPEVN